MGKWEAKKQKDFSELGRSGLWLKGDDSYNIKMEIDLEAKVARLWKTHSANGQTLNEGGKTMICTDLDFSEADPLEVAIGYLEWFTIHRLRKYGPTGAMADLSVDEIVKE